MLFVTWYPRKPRQKYFKSSILILGLLLHSVVFESCFASHRKESNSLKDEWTEVCSRAPISFECSPSSPPALKNCDIKCNGDAKFCDLRFDQVTFAGAHNAGSGFDGGLARWGKINNPFMDPDMFNCVAINQQMSIYDQLEHGIRYLDVDIKFDECAYRLGSGHMYYCTGPVCKMLDQIEDWMRLHTTETVVLHFNRDVDNPIEAFPELIVELEKRFNPQSNRPVRMNNYFSRTGMWPTLRQSIADNQRLFVFIDNAYLSTNETLAYSKSWIHGSGSSILRNTWKDGRDVTIFNGCGFIVNDNADMCKRNSYAPFLALAVFGRVGMCLDSMAKRCNDYINEAADECYNIRSRVDKIVNFIQVDFPKLGDDRVSETAFRLNLRNYMKFRPRYPQCRFRGQDMNSGQQNMTALQTMRPGQFLLSPNKLYRATIKCDGSFVMQYKSVGKWRDDDVIFRPNTLSETLLVLLPGGNLMLLSGNNVVWQVGIMGRNPKLTLLNYGTLYLLHDEIRVWSSVHLNKDTCIWVGTEPFCSGSCPNGLAELYRDDGYCWFGTKAFCCP